MNHICTWLCADKKGEESVFPQSGQKSSSQTHQNIYWRCLIVFFITSKRFNKNEKHVLFTNVNQLPEIEGKKVSDILKDLEVEVVYTDFKYKTPKGYHGCFQNQFYEFSILEHIAQNNHNSEDKFLILDSDCLFVKPAFRLFQEAEKNGGFISFAIDSPADYVINGLSRKQMQKVFSELLGEEIEEAPDYHLGEFLLCSVSNIKKLYQDFLELWPQLLQRHALGLDKLNEEAHTLSYLYYKNNLHPSKNNIFIKRIWTNPLFYRNVSTTDVNLTIWHLPAEKTFGFAKLYELFVLKSANYGRSIHNYEFQEIVQEAVTVPYLPVVRKFNYYTISCYKAFMKKVRNFNLKNVRLRTLPHPA